MPDEGKTAENVLEIKHMVLKKSQAACSVFKYFILILYFAVYGVCSVNGSKCPEKQNIKWEIKLFLGAPFDDTDETAIFKMDVWPLWRNGRWW